MVEFDVRLAKAKELLAVSGVLLLLLPWHATAEVANSQRVTANPSEQAARQTSERSPPTHLELAHSDVNAVKHSYVSVAAALYSNALGTANALTIAISTLETAQTNDNLLAARTAWSAARTAHLSTSAFGVYASPMDGAKRISDTFLRLERALWATPDNPNAILRKWAINAAGTSGACVSLQTELAQVLKEWDVIRRTGYAQKFIALGSAQAVQRILRGITVRALELANAQNSSEKHADSVRASLSGIESIWHARLNNISAASVADLIGKIDSQAAIAVTEALRAAQIAAGAPDTQVNPGADRAKQKLLLRALAAALDKVRESLGVDFRLD